MSKKSFEDGKRDGEHNHYEPPHQRNLDVIGEVLDPYSSKESEDRKDYNTGYRIGRKNS